MTAPVIFFDLDGVLADFVSGVLAVHQSMLPVDDVDWGIEKQLGVEPSAFWGPLGRDFWAGLAPLADGFRLLRMAERVVPPDRIALLSSPCDTDGCRDGKQAWVNHHLPEYRRRLILGSAKDLIASPGKVLVDDHDPNCDRWAAAGGVALTPPRPWNRRKPECLPGGRFDPPALFRPLLDAVRRSV